MTHTNKEDRANIHAMIWKACNELRGAVDGWDFKQYVLGILFYRFISENLASYLNEQERRYADLSDEEVKTYRNDIVREKGFFISPSELFENIHKNADNYNELSEKLASIFKNIEESALGTESEEALKDLFEAVDFTNKKLGLAKEDRNKRLKQLLSLIAALPIAFNETPSDVLGDAYEYLMKMYATQAGKSGGEFFTPPEVSELVAKIVSVDKEKIKYAYDPACGSGSLLLALSKVGEVGNFSGQEINPTSHALCRANMLLHGVAYYNFNIALGDTLTAPNEFEHKDGKKIKFNAIVSNPPYSIKWEGNSNPELIKDERFSPAGVLAPKSRADIAFVMHCLHNLADDGTAAIVVFPGMLFRSGAEQKIRKYLIDNNYVDAVIQLPENLFFGTAVSTCILVLKKNRDNKEVLFIDAQKQFVKDGNKNKLTPENIARILDGYTNKEVVKHFSHLASYEEIATKEFDLSPHGYQALPEREQKLLTIECIKKVALDRRGTVKKFWNAWDEAIKDAEAFVSKQDEWVIDLMTEKVNKVSEELIALEIDTISMTEKIREAMLNPLFKNKPQKEIDEIEQAKKAIKAIKAKTEEMKEDLARLYKELEKRKLVPVSEDRENDLQRRNRNEKN